MGTRSKILLLSVIWISEGKFFERTDHYFWSASVWVLDGNFTLRNGTLAAENQPRASSAEIDLHSIPQEVTNQVLTSGTPTLKARLTETLLLGRWTGPSCYFPFNCSWCQK